MKYFLGIDGGGTKTTAAVADETGKIICRVAGKTLNFYAVCMEACRENLKSILKEIQEKYNISSFYATFIGCSALDGEADGKTIAELCDGIINSEKIGMNSDAFVALKASKGNCVAICGTGSMAMGENKDGALIVKGGWGHIIGDEGSAYAISIKALKLCCRLCDEKEQHPVLDKAMAYFGVDDFRKAIDTIYSIHTTKDFIAGFGAQVGELAQLGCEDAQSVIKEEAIDYARTVNSLIKSVDGCRLLSLYGGVFKNSALFTEEFSREIHSEYPNTQIELLSLTPEEGAIKVAMELK